MILMFGVGRRKCGKLVSVLGLYQMYCSADVTGAVRSAGVCTLRHVPSAPSDRVHPVSRQSLLGRLGGTVSRLLPQSWVPGWLREEEEEAPPPAADPSRAGPSGVATRRHHLNAVTTTTTTAWEHSDTGQLLRRLGEPVAAAGADFHAHTHLALCVFKSCTQRSHHFFRHGYETLICHNVVEPYFRTRGVMVFTV